MRTEVIIHKEINGGFSVEIPLLDTWTQGETIEECHAMAVDAVRELLITDGEHDVSCIKAFPESESLFTLQVPSSIVGFAFKQLRKTSDLKVSDVVKSIGGKSNNHILQYESGRRSPGIEQMESLFGAFDLDFVVSSRSRTS
jgi:predicted RNase H-like HicB family nuclease